MSRKMYPHTPIKLDKSITTMEQLFTFLNQNISVGKGRFEKNNLCVILFTSSYCRPCTTVKSRIFDETTGEGLAKKFYNKGVVFFYVDISVNEDLSSEFTISSIPHFYLMKVTGGNPESKCNFRGGSELEERIERYV
jgi:thioredoxin-like negative regulator of GroEL